MILQRPIIIGMSAELSRIDPLRTTEQWEGELGLSFKRLRLMRNMTQRELALAASISVGAVQNLETGSGSTLRTLIALTRVLGRTEWLNALLPPLPKVSPMELLRKAEKSAAPKSRSRSTSKVAT